MSGDADITQLLPLSLVLPNDPILSRVMLPFVGDASELRPLAKAMTRLMIEKRGVGLAAPQVGYEVRMFIYSPVRTTNAGPVRVCINPVIVSRAGNRQVQEGCLTWPGRFRACERPESIVAQWMELDGAERTGALSGLAAQCFVHELMHLNGQTIF